MKPILLTLIAILLSPPAALHAAERIAAFTPGARILFQGDSITDGNRGRGTDPNHILEACPREPLDLGRRPSHLLRPSAHMSA